MLSLLDEQKALYKTIESLWLDAIEPLALLKWIALHQRQETAVAEPIYNRSSSQMGWSQNRTIK